MRHPVVLIALVGFLYNGRCLHIEILLVCLITRFVDKNVKRHPDIFIAAVGVEGIPRR